MLGEATAVRTARRGEERARRSRARAGAARGVTARAAETAWAAMSTEEERRARTPRQNVRGGTTTARAMTSRIADAWRRKLRASPPEASRGEHVTKADFHDFVRVGSQKIVYQYEAFSPYPPSFCGADETAAKMYWYVAMKRRSSTIVDGTIRALRSYDSLHSKRRR